jgi:hypothetical protein
MSEPGFTEFENFQNNSGNSGQKCANGGAKKGLLPKEKRR